jgi:hypothetical protein
MNRESQGWIAWAGYLWLVFVGACVVAASWTGLVGFAENILGIEGRARVMVPVSLDGLAVTLAFLSLRAVLAGDAAAMPRILAWIVVGAGAGFNYYHAQAVGQGEAAAVYFGGMTLLVYLGFEVILRQLRREQLRAQGAVERPLPRFRLARWVRFPGSTFHAWSTAVEQGITEPTEAIHSAALKRAEREQVKELELDERRPELEVRETRTTTRSVTARGGNGTMAARIRELYAEGARTVDDITAQEPGFQRESVRKTLARIEQQQGGEQ